MKSYLSKYKIYFTDRSFLASVGLSVLLLIAGLVVNFYAGEYATLKASNAVNDIILDNIPVYDVSTIFIYGPFIMWLFVAFLCLREPKIIPFVLKNIALFTLIRALFITLTHIGPFPDHLEFTTSTELIKNFTFGGDLFFSGHTGLPFLMSLVFIKRPRLRLFFLAVAVFFAAIVLMAHLHYSIDVASAFFITYTIYHIAKYLFKEDERVFNEGL